MALEGKSFSLDVLWSTEIVGAPPVGTTGTLQFGAGLVLDVQSMFADGRIVWLGSQIGPSSRSKILLVDADRTRPDRSVALELQGGASAQRRSLLSWFLGGNTPNQKPSVLTLAVGSAGKIWVAGLSNAYLDMLSGDHSDAYLAAVDETGRPLWERTYRGHGRRLIRSVTQIASGDLAIAGSDGGQGWVARLSPDGDELWGRHLGNNLDNAIAALPDDRLILAGFEGVGSGRTKDYQNHVTTWIIDGSGATLAKIRIRDSISQRQHSHFGRVSVMATPGAVYVASNWKDPFNAQPVEIAKLRLDGTLMWKVVLQDTISAVDTAVRTRNTCSPTLSVNLNPSGDVVVACSLEQIQIYKLDGHSGRYHESYLSLPECQTGLPAVLFLAIRNDGTMILSGSRPAANVGRGCTWIGRLAEIS